MIYQDLDNNNDIKSARSFLNQLIDVLQEDISGSTSRRKYQHFVTGGIGPGVTSSLYQTVYDQDFTLQTANPIFDVTVGLSPPLSTNTTSIAYSVRTGTAGSKDLYTSSSLMMREKTDIYRQFSQILLGNDSVGETKLFTIPLESAGSTTTIDAALFIAFKRLFARDQIKRETFAMRFYQSASMGAAGDYETISQRPNLIETSISGSAIFTDLGSSQAKFTTFGGQYGIIKDASNTAREVGLLFYDAGVAVFDLNQILSGTQFVSGTIDAVNALGKMDIGGFNTALTGTARFIPDFMTSGSIDNIVDHLCATRFQSGSLTAVTFQNVTSINSTLVFCRAAANKFNYSSNPTFVDTQGRTVVIDPGEEDKQETFTYVTSVGLYDATENLLAVAKLSRPVEKSPERDVTFRIRLDF
jgi:hypothetical protein